MLRDDGFSSKAKVDRYGRKLPQNAGRQDLQKYYSLDDNEDDGSDEDGTIERVLEQANARQETHALSTSDESSSEDEEADSAEEDEVFGILEEQQPNGKPVPVGEASPRIAVVNLDWDNIRAIDLMAVFSSFVPSGGRILKISIYPSDFGKERMEKEDLEGPPREIFGVKEEADGEAYSSSSEEDDPDGLDEQDEEENIKQSLLKEDTGEEFNSSKLRRYQMERLRYYFAVLICSSTPVAQAIYEAVDGTEYLTTANFFDLRFVPSDVDFSADKARDECERVPDGYKPNEFITDALQHSKVKLTWDAEDRTRKEAQKRAFGGSRADIDDNDLKAYIGSDSSDDEVPEPVVVDATSVEQPEDTVVEPAVPSVVPRLSKKDAGRQRMRALLGLAAESSSKISAKNNDRPVGEMQITFSSGLSGANKGSVFENEPEREETTVEKYIRKEKERKNRRKEKMKNARDGGNSNAINKEDKELPVSPEHSHKDLGFSDPFFAEPAKDHTSRKAQKWAKHHEELTATSADADEERENLERIVRDDNAPTDGQIQHFDASLIAKGEKLASKKRTKKRQKISKRKKEALEAKAQDDLKVDTQDSRFSAVNELSEFAIDPSHKAFRDTEGMRTFLEAGRKKRRREEE